MAKIYELNVPTPKNGDFSLKEYEGRVMLIVNTATGCGFTPLYEPIEKMYEEFHDKGFEVVDIPCNQFNGQTPGNDDEIHEFCTMKYKTQFPQMKKSDVNGENELPLYTYLKSQQSFKGFTGNSAAIMDTMLRGIDPNYDKNPDIKWNFTMFLVDRNGNVTDRFEPTADFNDVRNRVLELL